jgi:tetratricopeptide (TPR) repeat protein
VAQDTKIAAMRYVAFISYNHRDRARARWVHRQLESYRIPRSLQGRSTAFGAVGARLYPIFIDREEMPATADLAATAREALNSSAYLIVLCSPDSARSRWVNEEVRQFKALGRRAQILPIIVAGEPRVSSLAPDDIGCFPPALWYSVVDGRVTNVPDPEALAADLRPGTDEPRHAMLKIAAGILGVAFDDLRRRDQVRRQKRLAMIATAATFGCVVFAGLAVTAWLARGEAERQRALAERQSQTAQRTAAFLKSLFRVSDPSEARGNSITAREILDRGAKQLDTELRAEPLVHADLAATLGEVYTSLGLLKPATDLLSIALRTDGQEPSAMARQRAALGTIELLQGRYQEADRLFAAAASGLDSAARADPKAAIDFLCAWGDALTNLERYEAAREKYERAGTLAVANFGETSEGHARALEGLGYVAFYAGDLNGSRDQFLRALRMREVVSGASHPQYHSTLNQLGAVEYMLGHRTEAADYMRRSLDVGRRVLGEGHVELGQLLNNLGRVELEQRDFARAGRHLEEALRIHLSQRDDRSDDVTFSLTNLAIERSVTGRLAEADALFGRALASAIATKHRLHGPILTDWASLDCRRGRIDAGLRRLDEARPIVAQRYPNDPWRVALVDSVRAECELERRHFGTAEQLLKSSNAALFAKWPPNTLYGYDAIQRNVALYERESRPDNAAVFRKMLR